MVKTESKRLPIWLLEYDGDMRYKKVIQFPEKSLTSQRFKKSK